MSGDTTLFVQQCLKRMQDGDESAQAELIAAACGRMQRLAHRMLDDYARLRRWEETDDVFSGAAMRLSKALTAVTPESPKHFFRLAALQIRRELKELARRHTRDHAPQIYNASDANPSPNQTHGHSPMAEPEDVTHDPSRLAQWAELHERVENLPPEHREVFEIIWYNEITQVEAAEILGVSRRTVIRRWQAACLQLYEEFNGQLPGQS